MLLLFLFFFNDTATTEIYTLSLHDALPIYASPEGGLALHLERQERAVRGEPRVLLEVRSASVVAVAHLHIDAAVTPHGRDLRAGHPLLKEHRVMAGRVGERRARECEGGGGRGHDAHGCFPLALSPKRGTVARARRQRRSEEHTSELQSQSNLVCRLLLEKKKKKNKDWSDQS